MVISQDKVVTIRYTLRVDGEVLDQGELPYLHGHRTIVEGLEEALEGLEAGQSVRVSVPPEKGYGLRDPEGVQVVSRGDFPPEAEVVEGAQFYTQDTSGNPLPLRVTGVQGDEVTIDFNHPLAGDMLDFEVLVSAVRTATAEELEHGHVHNEGGHQH